MLRKPKPDPYNLGSQRRPGWLDRASCAVDLLQSALPSGSIADIGCGDKKVLAEIKARGLSYAYRGFDIGPQEPDVTAFDLSHQELSQNFDAVMLLGVLEYLSNPDDALRRICDKTQFLIVSHVNPDDRKFTPDEIKAKNWTTVLPGHAFENLIRISGFDIIERRVMEDTTRLWLCAKRSST